MTFDESLWQTVLCWKTVIAEYKNQCKKLLCKRFQAQWILPEVVNFPECCDGIRQHFQILSFFEILNEILKDGNLKKQSGKVGIKAKKKSKNKRHL